MKIYKNGLPLLLCCASTVLCGCSSDNTVSTPFWSYSIQAFVQADFDLIQKGTVEINTCFGVAARDVNTTWDDVVYEYHIDYFKLHVYSSPYCLLEKTSFEQAVETLKDNVCISKDFIVDVSSNSSTKVEEKKYKNKNFNDGEPLKLFCVKQTISIPAEEFEFKGDGANFYLSCGAYTSAQKLAERYQREIKEGTIFGYTYKEGTVKFKVDTPFMSYSPVVLE